MDLKERTAQDPRETSVIPPKKIVIIAVVVIVAGLLLAIPRLVDANRYRAEIQTQLQARLNRPVQLGALSLGMFPIRVDARNVIIGEDPSFGTAPPFAEVGDLEVRVRLFPLFAGKIEIDSLDLRRPRIELIRNAQGSWNFSTAANASAAPSPAPGQHQAEKPAPSQAAPAKLGFTLRELKISDGQIAITDDQKGEARAVYDHIDATLKNYAPGAPFSLELTAHLPGNGSQTVRVTGSGGPVNDAGFASTPFKGTLKLDEVSLSAAQQYLHVAALENSDAVILGSINLSNAGGMMSMDGSVKLDQASIHGVQVGSPISADFDLTDDMTTGVIQIRKGELKLGTTPISFNGTLNRRPHPPVIDVNLSTSNASIADAARLAAAFGVAFSPDARIFGQLTAKVHAQGPSDRLGFDGNVNGRNLEITGKQIPRVVRVPAIDLTLTPGQIQSNNFTATSGGTSLGVQLTIAQYTGEAPNVEVSLKTIDGKVEEVLGMAKAYGLSAAEGVSGSGDITFDVRATGPVKNPDAMQFSGSGALQNASLKLPSLTKPLHIHNANIQFTQKSVSFTHLNTSLGSTNATGNLSIANFPSPRLSFALTADKLDVVELEQIAATAGPQNVPPRKKADAWWSLIPAADAAPAPGAHSSFLRTATGNGTITVGAIVYQQTVLSNVHSKVTLNQGIIQLNPLTSQIYGGQQSGSVTVDTRPTPLTYAVNAKLINVDANKMLSSVSPVKDKLYGTVEATTNVTFSQPDAGEIVQTLTGTVVMNLANGKIMKLDLPGELARIGKFSGVKAKGYTEVSQMSGTFNLHNGVAQTNDLKAALDIGTIAANGAANLVTQDLNLHVTAVLSKAFSQSVGGTAVGGYLNTALANKNGELVLPVLITGNMNHPMVVPDVQQIAKMKLNILSPNNPLGKALEQLLKGAKKH